MIFKYRIVKNFTPNDKIFLENLGISIKLGWDVFEINEVKSEVLNHLKAYFGNEWEDISQRLITYSNKEVSHAEHLYVYAKKYLGYAKPDVEEEVETFEPPFDIYPYYKDVFEVFATDESYGLLRGKQIGNYQLKGKVKWGKSAIGSAHYINDAFFVKEKVYNTFLKPLNIESCPVIDYKTKKKMDGVVQILQQGISASPLQIVPEDCKEIISIPQWGIQKYILRDDIPYPRFKDSPGDYDFFYTQEHFGSGGLTQRGTIISQKFYEILKKNNIKGLNFHPLITQ